LRIADLLRDQALLEEARRNAHALVTADPGYLPTNTPNCGGCRPSGQQEGGCGDKRMTYNKLSAS